MGPLGVTITQTADALGVSRKHISAIVNGRVPVSPDMAARPAGVFGTEPDIWINLQAQYDLWQVRQQGRPKVKRLAARGLPELRLTGHGWRRRIAVPRSVGLRGQ